MSAPIEVRLQIRRPVRTAYYTDTTMLEGPPILPGATAVVELAVCREELCIEQAYVEPRPSGHEYDPCDVLRGAALVPCEHLHLDSDERLGHPDYFDCNQLSVYADHIAACMGDKARCPMAWVRAEAAASLETTKEEPNGEG